MKRAIKLSYITVGYGNIGHKRHAVLGEKCIATVDPSPTAKADFTDVSQIPNKLIEKCDAVVITIPRSEKLEAIKFWFERKKHVLVEKPLIISAEEAKDLQKLAKKNGVIWYTAYNYRFEPHIIKIKKLIDEGFLGKIYSARFVYGFGNVRQLIGTWREVGSGALEEIGCHFIDLAQYLLGYKPGDVRALSLRKVEAKTFDYCLLATKDLKVLIEVGWVMWKNTFVIEIYGEHGSLHMDGLCKWGDSELIVRKRVLPAGVPEEERFIVSGPPDPTWGKDIQYFEEMVRQKKTSYESDLILSDVLISLVSKGKSGKAKNNAYKLLRGSAPSRLE